VRVAGTAVHLAPREFALVEYLLAEAPRLVSWAEIAEVIGDGQQVVSPVRIRKYVQNLRRKLTKSGQPAVLENVRGLGYRLVDTTTTTRDENA
jgi:two-component system, OmpR family, response regulator